MASSRDYSFLNFLFFCILLQQSLRNCNASSPKCAEPKFDSQQAITVDYYFKYDIEGYEREDLCSIIGQSNGLISMVRRMGADMDVDSNGKLICNLDEKCLAERQLACSDKIYKDKFNDCPSPLLAVDGKVADCVCEAASDDILAKNKNDYIKSKATVLPALVVNQVFDPCFIEYSYASMKAYFCKAYQNALPLCK